MDYVPRLDQIRSLICQTFAELGGTTDRMPREAVLIRDGYFCGRRFEADGLQAVWFTEENEIKFYDRDGADCPSRGAGRRPFSPADHRKAA